MASSNDADYGDRPIATPTCACFQETEQHPLDSSDCPACAIKTCIAQSTPPQMETVEYLLRRVRAQIRQAHEARQITEQGILEIQTQLTPLYTGKLGGTGQPGRSEAHNERTPRLPRIDPHEMQQRVLDQISAIKEWQQQFLRAQLHLYLLIHIFMVLNISTRGTFPESYRQMLFGNAEHLRQLDISAQEYLEALQTQLETIQIIINTPTL